MMSRILVAIPGVAVILAAVVAIIITLPALLEVNIGTEEAPIPGIPNPDTIGHR